MYKRQVIVHVKTIDETAAYLSDDNQNKILVLLRSIEGIKKLIKKTKISSINIGGEMCIRDRDNKVV